MEVLLLQEMLTDLMVVLEVEVEIIMEMEEQEQQVKDLMEVIVDSLME